MLSEEERVLLHEGDVVLYKRTEYRNSTWQYRIRLKDGNYERKSSHKKNIDDAKRVVEDRYQEIRFREGRGLSNKRITFERAAQEWIAEERRKFALQRRTKMANMERNITLVERYFIPYFEGKFIADITTADVNAYHLWYRNTWKATRSGVRTHWRTKTNRGRLYAKPLMVVAPGANAREPHAGTVVLAQRVLRAIFVLAVRNSHISESEQPMMELISNPPKRRGVFTIEEQKILLARLHERVEETGARHHKAGRQLLFLYVRLHLLSGLRPGKESVLRFKDIVYKDSPTPHVVIMVRDGKTGPRHVLVSNELREVVEALRAQHPNPTPDSLLWTKPNGDQTRTFLSQFTAVLKELKMTIDDDGLTRTLYSLRHSYITDRLTLNISPDKIALNCGTSMNMIQQHYAHLFIHNHVELLTRPL